AYPGIKGARIEVTSTRISAWIEIDTASPTPAYRFEWGMDVDIIDTHTANNRPYPAFGIPPWDMVRGAMTTMNAGRDISPPQLQSLGNGMMRAVVWGHVRYDDVFGKTSRYIRFRYRHGRDLSNTGGMFVSAWLEPEVFESN